MKKLIIFLIIDYSLLIVNFSFAQNSAKMTVHLTGKTAITYKLSEIDSITFIPCKNNFICGDNLIDIRDRKSYKTIQIGAQCWMKENLNVGKFVNSVTTNVEHSDVINDMIIEKYCYDNDSIKCKIYGGLYDWNEMMNYTTNEITQGICPIGWHLPAYSEWTTLIILLGDSTIAGGKLKETNITHWNYPNTGATDESGFTALPGGSRYNTGNFVNIGNFGGWWLSTESDASNAWHSNLGYNDSSSHLYKHSKVRSMSVRCLKD